MRGSLSLIVEMAGELCRHFHYSIIHCLVLLSLFDTGSPEICPCMAWEGDPHVHASLDPCIDKGWEALLYFL